MLVMWSSGSKIRAALIAILLGIAVIAGSAVMTGTAAASAAGAISSTAGDRITITDLGTLGGAYSFAVDVNERGQVAGRSYTADGSTHAFLWDSGRMRDLGTLGGTQSRATAINDAGLITGTSLAADGSEHAFVWWHGRMTDLGPGSGIAVNERGQVLISVDSRAYLWSNGTTQQIGTSGPPTDAYNWLNDRGEVAGSTQDPYLWRDGRFRSLGLPSGVNTSALGISGISNRTDVIANAVTADGLTHGFGWYEGTWTPVADPARASTANAVNAGGSIAGNYLQPFDLPDRAFLRHGATITTLADISGHCQATGAIDLNDRDDVVGYCTAADNGRYIGTLWRQGRAYALPGLGVPGPDVDPIGDYRSTYVSDINNRRQIAGTGYVDSGAPHAVLLQY